METYRSDNDALFDERGIFYNHCSGKRSRQKVGRVTLDAVLLNSVLLNSVLLNSVSLNSRRRIFSRLTVHNPQNRKQAILQHSFYFRQQY
jgi:hypothetical protein